MKLLRLFFITLIVAGLLSACANPATTGSAGTGKALAKAADEYNLAMTGDVIGPGGVNAVP